MKSILLYAMIYFSLMIINLFCNKELDKLWKNYSPTVMFRGTPCI